MPNLPNGSKGDSNPDSLDCESGILPLSYCAPRISSSRMCFINLNEYEYMYKVQAWTQLFTLYDLCCVLTRQHLNNL